jgi:hypothetical protein
MHNFPQELVNGTLDHLDEDHDTLKMCALVASTWTPQAQRHLFSSVLLDGIEKTERLACLLEPPRLYLANYIHIVQISLLPIREADPQHGRNNAFHSHSRALLPILLAVTQIQELHLMCGRDRDFERLRPFTELYLLAWFMTMIMGVLSK